MTELLIILIFVGGLGGYLDTMRRLKKLDEQVRWTRTKIMEELAGMQRGAEKESDWIRDQLNWIRDRFEDVGGIGSNYA